MKRFWILLILAPVGCSTVPQAGFMDRFFPSKNACAPPPTPPVAAGAALGPYQAGGCKNCEQGHGHGHQRQRNR